MTYEPYKTTPRNSYGSSESGPSWLYHFPQQSQFNSPFTSLQYEDLVIDSRFPAIPANLNLSLGSESVQIRCPYCHEIINTVTEQETGCLNQSVFAVLCIFCCWPCALATCFVSKFKDVIHTCPNCKRHLDTFRRKLCYSY